jgi:gas vesicle protein
MDTPTQGTRQYGFGTGICLGALVGASLVVWLAPRVAEDVRRRATRAARQVAHKATDTYRQASDRIGSSVDELAGKAQRVRNDVADAVVLGAQAVEQYAAAAKTERVAPIAKHSAV